MRYSWDYVITIIGTIGYHQKISIDENEIEAPSQENGFVEAMGEPEFQLKDFRKTIFKTECLHVQVFKGHYSVHRDKVDPTIDPTGHLIEDAPEIPISLLVGGLVGLAAGKNHYEKRKEVADHPVLESVLVGLGSGGAVSGLLYLLGKLIREELG